MYTLRDANRSTTTTGGKIRRRPENARRRGRHTVTVQPERPLGAVWSTEGACGCLLWAPKAEKVDVHLIHPGDRVIAMQPLDGGYFTVDVEGVAPGALYRYCLDGQTERPDP